MFTFSIALEYLKDGKKITRVAWKDGSWLCLNLGHRKVPATRFWTPATSCYVESLPDQVVEVLPSIIKKDCNGSLEFGWPVSHADLLSADWKLVD